MQKRFCTDNVTCNIKLAPPKCLRSPEPFYIGLPCMHVELPVCRGDSKSVEYCTELHLYCNPDLRIGLLCFVNSVTCLIVSVLV